MSPAERINPPAAARPADRRMACDTETPRTLCRRWRRVDELACLNDTFRGLTHATSIGFCDNLGIVTVS